MPAEGPRDAGEHRDSKATAADPDSLRAAMRLFPTGVTVVTSGKDEDAEGMTANAVISVSLDPPLFLVSVHREARLNPRIKKEGYFAVSVLSDEQEGVSRLFASPERSSGLSAVRSLGGEYGVTGAPLAANSLAVVECELEAVYPGGDHELFLGRVVSARLGDVRKGPLVYHEGGYPTLKAAPQAEESGAFVDSVRGFDVRLSRFQKRGRRR